MHALLSEPLVHPLFTSVQFWGTLHLTPVSTPYYAALSFGNRAFYSMHAYNFSRNSFHLVVLNSHQCCYKRHLLHDYQLEPAVGAAMLAWNSVVKKEGADLKS